MDNGLQPASRMPGYSELQYNTQLNRELYDRDFTSWHRRMMFLYDLKLFFNQEYSIRQ